MHYWGPPLEKVSILADINSSMPGFAIFQQNNQ